MPERPVKVHFPLPDSPLVDGNEVAIQESTERWSEVQLEDGTVIRVKPMVLSAVRIQGQYDADGNPAYSIKLTPVVHIIAPDLLKNNATAGPVQ